MLQVKKKHATQKMTQKLILMKLVYLLSCLINLIIGIWKLNSMGLIPNKQSDWLPFESKLLSKEKFI